MANVFAQTEALAFGKTADEVRAEGTPERAGAAPRLRGQPPDEHDPRRRADARSRSGSWSRSTSTASSPRARSGTSTPSTSGASSWARCWPSGSSPSSQAPTSRSSRHDSSTNALIRRYRAGRRPAHQRSLVTTEPTGLDATPAGDSESEAGAARGDFPPIADYAFLSDCEISTLIAPDGSGRVALPAAPRLAERVRRAARPVRRRLPASAPAGIEVPNHRRYVPGTHGARDHVAHADGLADGLGLLVDGTAGTAASGTSTTSRAPGDFDRAGHAAPHRDAASTAGSRCSLNCVPVVRLRARERRVELRRRWLRQAVDRRRDGDLALDLTGSMRARHPRPPRYGRTTLEEGEIGVRRARPGAATTPTTSEEAAGAARRTTAKYWRDWLSSAKFPDHPWRPYLERSALALKGLSYAPTGAIMAAGTTSLPETPGGERNWDYRYTWIRDTAFMLRGPAHARLRVGGVRVLRLHRSRRSRRAATGSSTADHVRHRRRDRSHRAHARPPLRLRQRAPGARSATAPSTSTSTTCGACCSTRSSIQPAAGWRRCRNDIWDGSRDLVDDAVDHWPEPDQGIWEMRGEPQHFVASKVMCWVAARPRRAARAGPRRRRSSAERWRHGGRRDQGRDLRQGHRRPRRLHPALRAPTPSTRRSCSSRSWASCRRTTSACARPCSRSPTSSPRTAWCCATGSSTPTTGSRARRARSRSARSGSSPRSP